MWTLIGVFAAIMLGSMTLMTTLINRTTRATIGELRGEMLGGFAAVEARFEAVGARFEAVEARFEARFEVVDIRLEALGHKIDQLDRDIGAINRKIWGDPTP